MNAGFWVAVVAPVSALGGVIWGSWWSGRNMIKTERERARLAEAAEDRRLRDEIRAEDRRHEKVIRLAWLERNLDAVRSLYVELETARRELQVAEIDLAVALRAEDTGDHAQDHEQVRAVYARATAEFGLVRDRASLDASDVVKDYADLLYSSALVISRDPGLLPVKVPAEVASNFAQFVRSRQSETQRASDLLSDAMRRELRAENG